MTESGCCPLVTHQEDEDGRPRKHGAPYEADEETESEHDGTVEIRPPSVTRVKALTAPNKCSWNPDGEMSALAFFKLLGVRSLAVARWSRHSETEWTVTDYSRIGAYRTWTSGKDFPSELCAQNSGDASPVSTGKVITIEQAYVVTTIQA